jgi:TonB family protein
MAHALLLSPDDQAVSAISAVLEEMSVTWERPLDGPSAAKKLNSQSFDLVLVDCENLPAAKLIFDVCRRSQLGTNPVPIAIVDGRAGLPTAFRLGAELILTKPVAKDQARTTIRTAVSRVRKDESVRTIHPFEEAPSEPAHAAVPEKHTHAAAAGATSSPARSESAHATSAAPMTANMSSATEEIRASSAAATTKTYPDAFNAKPAASSIPATDIFMPAAKPPAKPSDDPVLADLESDSPTPVFSSYAEPQKKGRGSLWALLLLMVAGGGLYAAWMYQPGFREFAQPQIDRVMGMMGFGGSSQPTNSPRTTPATAPVPVKASATQAATDATTPSDAATTAAGASTPNPTPESSDASADSTAPTVPSASSTTAAASPASETAKPKTPAEPKKIVVAALPSVSDTELPGEKDAVILSSQGAEKRLIRHLPPAYPTEARKAGIEGTVVLKTVVSASGTVEGVRLVEGNPALAEAAIRSVKQWRYRPYLRNGKAKPFQTIVLVEFQRP